MMHQAFWRRFQIIERLSLGESRARIALASPFEVGQGMYVLYDVQYCLLLEYCAEYTVPVLLLSLPRGSSVEGTDAAA